MTSQTAELVTVESLSRHQIDYHRPMIGDTIRIAEIEAARRDESLRRYLDLIRGRNERSKTPQIRKPA
jgi:hypothetical protein